MNQEYHRQTLCLGHTEEIESEDTTDEKPARNPRQPGEDDQKTQKHQNENVFGGPKHDPEGKPGPQEVGGSNQFDPDTGDDDTDASPNLVRPNDAIVKRLKEPVNWTSKTGRSASAKLRHPTVATACPPFPASEHEQQKCKQYEAANAADNQCQAKISTRIGKHGET